MRRNTFALLAAAIAAVLGGSGATAGPLTGDYDALEPPRGSRSHPSPSSIACAITHLVKSKALDDDASGAIFDKYLEVSGRQAHVLAG